MKIQLTIISQVRDYWIDCSHWSFRKRASDQVSFLLSQAVVEQKRWAVVQAHCCIATAVWKESAWMRDQPDQLLTSQLQCKGKLLSKLRAKVWKARAACDIKPQGNICTTSPTHLWAQQSFLVLLCAVSKAWQQLQSITITGLLLAAFPFLPSIS